MKFTITHTNPKKFTVTNIVDDWVQASIDLINRMTLKPPYALRLFIKEQIKAWILDGTWAENDCIYQLNLHTEQASCLNWKGDFFNITPVGSPVWTYGVGYTIANNKYLRTGFIPSVHGINYILNSASLALGVANEIAVSASDMGASDTDNKISGLACLGWGSAYIAINQGSRQPIANATSLGYYHVMRSASNLTTLYKDGISIGTKTTVSTALTDQEITIGSEGIGGTNAVGRIYNCAKIGGVYNPATDQVITKDFNDNVASKFTYWDTRPINEYSNSDPATQVMLTLITPDGFGETIQPQVVNCGAPWNGYQYWLVDTPYHASDDSYEKICVWASTDGLNFVVPTGGANPLINIAPYADPDIYFDNNIMYIVFVDSTGGVDDGCLKMIHSHDGITWSASVIVASPVTGDTKMTSPSMIKIGSIYYIYYITENYTSTNVRRRSCATIDGTYTSYEVIDMPVYGGLDINIWYHCDVVKFGDYFWLISSVKYGGADQLTKCWAGRSLDGVTFIRNTDLNPTVTSQTGNIYRPTMMYIGTQMMIYWGGTYITGGGTWRLFRVNAELRL